MKTPHPKQINRQHHRDQNKNSKFSNFFNFFFNNEYKITVSFILLLLTSLLFLLLSSCVKINDKKNSEAEKPDLKLLSATGKTTKPTELKLCHRETHFYGVKKCLRKGQWIRITLDASDIDSDRIDVLTLPGMSIKRSHYYQDTIRLEGGVNAVTNYPDQFRLSSPAFGKSHFVFAAPINSDLPIFFDLWGRDENYSFSKKISELPFQHIVKIQHWNDGGYFKKYALLTMKTEDSYTATFYRTECSWMETDEGLVYNQEKTSEGTILPKIPETLAWIKPTEKCEDLSSKAPQLAPFKNINQGTSSISHGFTNDTQLYRKVAIKNQKEMEIIKDHFSLINPLPFFKITLDGKSPQFINGRNEPITRIEGISEMTTNDSSFSAEN